MRVLLALIIIVPAMEIGLLIFSGKMIGAPSTILLIILTGVLGAWLAKKQGLETLRKAQEQMSYGQMPGYAIVDGICILAGAIFLLTPGFITDLTGLLLLIPQTRSFIKPFIGKLFQRMINKGQFTFIRR
ncbi:FxsA family protein [Ferdinandcohnia quinoae]|uniref:Membrane protein FxsA n=1 Tax=Fredinandcohnia quinoae TaxID=2918902 RepID=A0AAW5ECP6_9BACI|nr:membrane protein FxsA [Fredinandcohnia sp. SECRCQ15]